MSFKDVAIVSVKGNDYVIEFWYMSKDEAINVLGNTYSIGKSGTLQNLIIYHRLWNMDKEIIKFDGSEIKKFHHRKYLSNFVRRCLVLFDQVKK